MKPRRTFGEVLDAGGASSQASSRSRQPRPSSPLRARPQTLVSGSRSWRQAGRDQRRRRPLVTGISDLALDHQHFLADADRHRWRERRASPSAACPWSRRIYAPASPAKSVSTAAAIGAPWLARGAVWDAPSTRGSSIIATRAANLNCRCQTSRACISSQCIARGRDAPPSASMSVSPDAMARGLESAHWPGRLQLLNPALLRRGYPDGACG